MTVSTAELRKRFRRARRDLSHDEQVEHSNRVRAHLLNSNVLQTKTCVGTYLANDGELDLTPVIDFLHEQCIGVAVPRLNDGSMNFVKFEQNERLVENKWQIQEPHRISSIKRDKIDMVLTPLVGFTDDGVRVGRGGGYYDRYFADGDQLMIGVAHELQRSNKLENNAWDIKMDAIVTEMGWRLCSKRARFEITVRESDFA